MGRGSANRPVVVFARRSAEALAVCTFLAYFAVTAAGDLFPLEHFGARFLTSTSDQVVAVTPGSPAARAGLQQGDRLLRIDGRAVRNTLDWAAVYARLGEGMALEVTLSRAGRVDTREVWFRRRAEGAFGTPERRVVLLTRAVQLITLLVGTVILVRVRSREALLAAWLLGTIGIYSVGLPPRMATLWRELPLVMQVLFVLPSLSKVLIGYILFALFRTLLGRGLGDRPGRLIAVPFVACGAWDLAFLGALLYRPAWLPALTPFLAVVVLVNLGAVLTALVMAIRGYRRCAPPDRRRLQWVLAGSALGCSAGAPTVAALWLGTDDPTLIYDTPVAWQVAYTGFLVMPVSFWWAIASRQLFDIGLVIRRGLQLMFARHALLVMTPATLTIVGVDGLLHRELSIQRLVQHHAAVYALTAASLLVFRLRREAWLGAIDRSLFRGGVAPVPSAMADDDAHAADAGSDSRLWVLAESVASGIHVDWQREAAGSDERLRQTILELQALERLMVVHGAGPADADVEAGSVPGTATSTLSHWGSFALRERIGAGQFGIVFRAWDPTLEREVAVKLLDSAAVDRDAYLREARHLARVRHPNVVHVYGADVLDAIPGFWMELVAGQTLADRVRQQGALDADEARRVGVVIASALGAIHAVGLVHQDVKAENVMHEPDGRLVLMDLGAVAPSSDRPRFGTPRYMAPELVAGDGASVQSDIFSLGVLLYYILSVAFPFETTTACVSGRDVSAAVQRLADHRRDLPSSMVAAVARALAPEPDARFATSDAMRRALTGGHS